MKKLVFLLVVILISGCVLNTEPNVTRIVETIEVPVTREVPVTKVVELVSTVVTTEEVTRVMETTRLVEVTRLVEKTRMVEVTSTPTPKMRDAPSAGEDTSLDSENGSYTTADPGITLIDGGLLSEPFGLKRTGSITIEITSLSIIDIDAHDADLVNDAYELGLINDDSVSIGLAEFIVTNANNVTVRVRPWYKGIVQVNNEQVRLGDFREWTSGDDLDGEILSGSSLVGKIVFVLNRVSAGEVNKITYCTVDTPYNAETYEDLGTTICMSVNVRQ